MPSQLSVSNLSTKEYKEILKDPNNKQSNTRTSSLHQGEILLTKSKWFKGSRDRGFRGQIASKKVQRRLRFPVLFLKGETS